MIQGLYSSRGRAFYREISKPRDSSLDFPIALKFDRHLDSSTADMPVKFQSDTIIIIPSLAASRRHEILR